MKQVKIFSASSIEEVEKKINEWLRTWEQRASSIDEFIQTESERGLTITIVYTSQI